MKKRIRLITVWLLTLAVLSGCSLLSNDDPVDISATENPTPEPPVNQVDPVDPGLAAPAGTQAPATDQQPEGTTGEVPAGPTGTTEAPAALPTPIALPPTAVPPTPTVDPTLPRSYIVKSGDVLGVIAQTFDVEIAEIRKANNLSGNMIKVGQELTIPPKGGFVESPAPSAPAPAPTKPVVKPTPVTCSSTAGHCVQSGDTMSAIARKHSVSVDALRAANPGVINDLIRIGDVIAIPSGGYSPPADSGGTAPVNPIVTPLPVQTVPQNDADCAARYPRTATSEGYRYYHDGKCFQSPINATGTPGPTTVAKKEYDCPDGYVGHSDGLCYPYGGTPVATATPIATAQPTPGVTPDANGACPQHYVKLNPTLCWLVPGVTVTPTPTPNTVKTTCGNGELVTDSCSCKIGDIAGGRCYHPQATPTP